MTDREREQTKMAVRLRRHHPPRPDESLRARVMEAAGPAAASAGNATLSERIWMSRGWRLAWAATLVVMLVGHALIPRLARGEARRNLALVSSSSGPGDGRRVTIAEQAARELGLEPAPTTRLAASLPAAPPRFRSMSLPPQE